MRSALKFLLLLNAVFIAVSIKAQVTPVAVTGFNQDAIAEGPPNSLVTTTLQVDGASSNRVMYTNAFRTFAGIAGGGLPDNGTIVSGADVYQLASYNGNNALYIYRSETRNLSLVTPASFTRLRLLGFSTEGASMVSVSLGFSDGSTTNYLIDYSLPDWFNGATNVVLQGFGRCSRVAAPPWGDDAFPSNPRMYSMEIILNCADRNKQLQTIFISNFSNFPNNAPFPNTVILAVSGEFTGIQNISNVVTACDCAGPNGTATVTVTGNSGPYTFNWPVLGQTGPTATSMPPGTHTCHITDANGCVRYYTVTVPLTINSSLAITASSTSICPGQSVTLTANPIYGNYSSYTWALLDPNLGVGIPIGFGTSITINPTQSGIYFLQGNFSLVSLSPCDRVAAISITVNPTPTSPVINNVTICPNSTATLQVQSPQPGFTYNWYDAATGGTLLNTGTSYTTPVLATNSTYYVEAISNNNCSSNTRTAAMVTIASLPATPQVSSVAVCPNANATLTVTNPQAGFVYNWYNTAAGGTAVGTGTSYTVNNVSAATTLYVETVNAVGCISAARTAVTVSLLPQLSQPVVTLTNTTFTSLTFSWNAVAGATGYQVTTNGGATYQTPSSGPLGTTHTVSGLTGNTTVIIQVRASGVQPCETSLLSAPVSGTTLSSKEIFVPNAFTPNGDGRNDVLFVYGNYVASIQFRIFNQWGQLVFVSGNISNGWNGTYNGQQQPVGVYAYTLKVVLQDGSVINKKGSVNLIR